MDSTTALRSLQDQLSNLKDSAEQNVVSGHHQLGTDLWLSCDPFGKAAMSCAPSGEGFMLHLKAGDSGAWAALGMKLSTEVLRQARYLGVLINVKTSDVFSVTPTLRYYLPDEMIDIPTSEPVIFTGGPREHLSYIPIDLDKLHRAQGCELNLFFQTDSFVADFSLIEPLLIL